MITVPILCVSNSNLSTALINIFGDFNCKLFPRNLSCNLSFQLPIRNFVINKIPSFEQNYKF